MSFFLETVDGKSVAPFGFGGGIDSEVALGRLPSMDTLQFVGYSSDALIEAKKYLFDEELANVKSEILAEIDYRNKRNLPIRPYSPNFVFSVGPTFYPENPFRLGEVGIAIGEAYEVSIRQFAEFTLRMLGRLNAYNPLEFNEQLNKLRKEFIAD